MKKFWAVFVIAVLGLFIVFGLPTDRGAENAESLRAVWIAGVYNIDFPSSNQLSAAEMRQELDEIVANADAAGLNAIFFQVRPTADAFYQSDIFPSSRWLVAQEGDELAIDPLAYLIKQAKTKNIAVHAWLNPYKVTRGSVANPAFDLSYMAEDNPLRKHSDILVFHSNGEVYMNPGEPKSEELILLAVQELLAKYDLSGIHYDDYFYPDGDFADQETFRNYGEGYSDIEDWRRDNVNQLIQDTYALVKSYDKNLLFGVSPSGIWANDTSNPLGSATYGGAESYYAHYADSLKWIEEGWVDYITPQIYWNIGYEAADYEVLINWWHEQTADSRVALYPGIAMYKLGDGSQSSAWLNAEEILRQIELNRALGIEGECFYGYSKIAQNYLGITDMLRNYYAN